MTGNAPHSDCNDQEALRRVQAKEIPARPLGVVDDPTWELLQKCWNEVPEERPRTLELYNTLTNLVFDPEAVPIPQGRLAVAELPERLKLQVKSLTFPPEEPKLGQLYVRFRYGNKGYKTKQVNGSGEYKWFVFRPSPLRRDC